MKLQGMSIVFALVCLPIVLVIAYYISLQVDTITLQNMYDSKLLDATYDAMSAFELNTANEDLSSVSDSLRTIIEASNNIFMNTLATNLGMSNASKSYLEPYIPSILYTLYDGYYIYAPTYAPTVITDNDGNAVSVGDLGVQKGANGKYTFLDPLTNEKYQEILEKVAQNNATDDEKSKKDDFEKKYTITVDETHKSTDYGQLLYETPFTEDPTNVKDSVWNSDTKMYENCTTSVEPAALSIKDGEYKYDENKIDAEYRTKNVLKSYIPYSARYVQNNLTDAEGTNFNADINVIYTLDNYITIDGIFTYEGNKKIYYTKSGYLIPFTQDKLIGETETKGKLSVRVGFKNKKADESYDCDFNSPLQYNQNEIQQFIELGKPVRIDILKDLDNDSSWETIIDIDDTNSVIIDATNSNRDSANAKLTRYENIQFALEEFKKMVKDNSFGDPSKEETTQKITDAYNNIKVTYAEEGVDFTKSIDEILSDLKGKINDIKYNMQLNSAAVYYAKAAIFSNWVKDNLSGLKISSIQDISGVTYSSYTDTITGIDADNNNYLNMWKDNNKVFDFSEGDNIYGTTEIKKDSSFYNHKLKVIRASIQYNLNLSMSAYNRHHYYTDSYYNDKEKNYKFNKNTDYAMPIMKENEWDQILNNISIVAFMQGVNCKLKTYNNYVVVSSSNNEIMTTVDNVYYAKKEEFNDENSEYHTFNCDKKETAPGDYISFTSKEVKYDKITTTSTVIPYWYDHKNLACYKCINDGNYKGLNIFDSSDEYYNLRKAFYIGVAKEKNDIYKMNAVKNSEGFEIIYINGSDIPSSQTSILDITKIKEIEVVFGAVDTSLYNENVVTFSVEYPVNKPIGGSIYNTLYSVPTRTSNEYTWYIKVDPNIAALNTDVASNEKFSIAKLYFNLQNHETSKFFEDNLDKTSRKLKKSIKEIRIIYK